MPKFDVRKLVIWLAILPLAIVVGAVAFSPKAVIGPSSKAQATPAPATTPAAPVLKPTALPVMYEFFTGW